ncbi:hypothetical protein [Sphingobacterium sp. SYP-B4668]|uniref:hypothetical protein n=1 Tax=Sphingobacterium sp. SYP-B4668 TaxID=2996035 RepID=UPI0022DE81A1|nr:hypothetical protein [Sphingobacterium sp. SYP-B4668]
MKSIICIVLFFALCFGFKAQAQEASIKTVSEELETLQGDAKEKLEFLMYGSPPKLLFDEADKPVYLWNTDKKIENVEITGKGQFDFLLSDTYANDYRNTKILVLRIKKSEIFDLKSEELKFFNSLEYLVVQFEEENSRPSILNQLTSLKLVEKLKDVNFLLEKIDNEDGHEG